MLILLTISEQGTLFDVCAIEKTRANLLATILLCCNARNDHRSVTYEAAVNHVTFHTFFCFVF